MPESTPQQAPRDADHIANAEALALLAEREADRARAEQEGAEDLITALAGTPTAYSHRVSVRDRDMLQAFACIVVDDSRWHNPFWAKHFAHYMQELVEITDYGDNGYTHGLVVGPVKAFVNELELDDEMLGYYALQEIEYGEPISQDALRVITNFATKLVEAGYRDLERRTMYKTDRNEPLVSVRSIVVHAAYTAFRDSATRMHIVDAANLAQYKLDPNLLL